MIKVREGGVILLLFLFPWYFPTCLFFTPTGNDALVLQYHNSELELKYG